MPQGTSWYTVEQANAKYCLEASLILKWVEQGVVRAEQADTRKMQVNAKDLEQKVRESSGI
ncbi:MAG: MerR family transcriptional regulator [Desulfuromonadales bacterium]|nr:MerR family transcriptional regulator [Desulfuromonadales bacterium]